MTISTPSPLLNRFEATPVMSPLCQKPPSPITAIGRRSQIGRRPRRRSRATCRSRGSNCRANGAKVANAWQPMSALIWVGPSSRCISLIAENTGRSGQPVQNVGGRGGSSPIAAAARGDARASAHARGDRLGIEPGGLVSVKNAASPFSKTSDVYSPTFGNGPLPSTRVCMSARRSSTLIGCSM